MLLQFSRRTLDRPHRHHRPPRQAPTTSTTTTTNTQHPSHTHDRRPLPHQHHQGATHSHRPSQNQKFERNLRILPPLHQDIQPTTPYQRRPRPPSTAPMPTTAGSRCKHRPIHGRRRHRPLPPQHPKCQQQKGRNWYHLPIPNPENGRQHPLRRYPHTPNPPSNQTMDSYKRPCYNPYTIPKAPTLDTCHST